MNFAPSPKQSLILWRMLTGETPGDREPMLSKAKPVDRKPLIDHGFITAEKRGRASYLLLTDRAWAWASKTADVTFPDANDGAKALQGLLRRLIPFLQQHDLGLASLFMDPTKDQETDRVAEHTELNVQDHPATTISDGSQIRDFIVKLCLELSGGQSKTRVPLAALRRRLPQVPRALLDEQLIGLQRDQKLVLYREDNSAALTEADHQAALFVGESPRHLVILEN